MARGRRVKGEGSIYFDKSGNRWVGQVDLGWVDGKRKTKRVTGKTAEAVRVKKKALQKLLDKGVTPDADTVTGWITHWFDAIAPNSRKPLRPVTVQEYRRYLDRYITPTIGHFKVAKLAPDHVRGMQTWMLKKGLSTTTVRQAHAIVQRSLKIAMGEGKVDRNVAQIAGAPSPARNPHPKMPTTDAQIVIRSASEDARLRCRLICALILGIRQGEALGLQWGDVSLVKGAESITVHESIHQIKGRGLITDDVKTVSSRRTLPLPPLAVGAFEAWQRESGGRGYVFHGFRGPKVPEGPRRDYEVWKKALEAAGVAHIPLHGARGTAASMLMSLGVPDRMIADILGHAQVKTSQAHYLRSDESQRRDALALSSSAME